MKKKFLALVMTLAMVLSLLPATALATGENEGETPSAGSTIYVDAKNGNDANENLGQSWATAYKTLATAVTAAKSGDTIILGEGNYTLYGVNSVGTTKGKDLTFIGQGADKTGWNIGALVPNPDYFGTEYNGDYSFDGAGTVTFQNMTLQSSTKDYLGFIRADKTVVKDCIINGKTFYWGYKSAEFRNTTFNCPKGDYALWTYSSPVMTFDSCTFNSSGKVINVYTDYDAGKHDITVNFKNCTVNNSPQIIYHKQVLNINDSNMKNCKYIINISGNNIVHGIGVDKITCSRLFGFDGKIGNNTGRLDVNFGGTAVWRDGKMVNEKTYHNEGVTVDGVSYNNGVDGANDSLYAEGYKDNAVTTKTTTQGKRTVTTKTCNYCGWSEESSTYAWDVSRSKTATELDSNRKSTVTLSLPSAEEELESDVVFVIDRSQCGKESATAAQQLVDNLLKRQKVTNAKIKVGIVIFGGTAIVSRELSEVTKAEELQNAMSKVARKGLHGSNIQSGLIEADKMLSGDTGDTTVANNRKYVVLISDGHTYQFSKEGDYYNDYTVGADSTDKFSGLTTYGIYSETDLFASDYGITYTLRSLKDEYFTGGWDANGKYTIANESYMTADKYKTNNSQTGVKNELEMPYGTWAEYLRHITEVVISDNGKYDKALAYDSTGDYDNQCIGKSRDGYTKETRANKADSILGNDKYIKCGLDGAGNDNQLMHASGVDRSVYEAYTKYASMAKKYNCYPIYVSKDNTDPNNYDAAKTTQDYGYQLIHAMGEISHNTGTSVAVANEAITQDKIKVNVATAFSSIQNDILYAVGADSVVEDKMGADFNFVPGSLKLTVDGEALDSKVDGDTTYFGAKNTESDIGSANYRFKVEYNFTEDKFTWTINENVSNFAPVQLSYQVKLVNANTAAGTYKVLTNEYAKLTPKNSAGQVGKELTFNNPEVSYTVSGGHSGGGTVTIPDDVPTGLNGKDHYAYVVGYPDGMVYPQKNITRAEVATIFFRLLTDETREANMTKSNSYNDMKDGAWYTCAVSTLSKMGIIKGYEDGSFKPDASISRAEFAAIAARFDPDGDTTPATFSDVSSHWAKDEISIAANHGWIKGYEDGSFKPDQKITRAETMTLVNRVLKRLPETKDDLHKDMKTWPDNQNESAWFYLAVQEATNSHYQKLKKDGTHETWESMRETRDWAALEK